MLLLTYKLHRFSWGAEGCCFPLSPLALTKHRFLKINTKSKAREKLLHVPNWACSNVDWKKKKNEILVHTFLVVVQLLSCVQLLVTPRTAAGQASLSFTISWSLLKLMSIESVMLSNNLILCHPLLLLPSIFLSIRVFSNESLLWPPDAKYWSFSFNISPSNEYLGLISFRMDWLHLLLVQGTLKSLL